MLGKTLKCKELLQCCTSQYWGSYQIIYDILYFKLLWNNTKEGENGKGGGGREKKKKKKT